MPFSVMVKIRYRSKEMPATIRNKAGKIRVVFKKPQRAITAGQSAVFYKGKELVGGGVIC
jgi:tRNA-specific 2-thiouridylase